MILSSANVFMENTNFILTQTKPICASLAPKDLFLYPIAPNALNALKELNARVDTKIFLFRKGIGAINKKTNRGLNQLLIILTSAKKTLM